MAISFIRCDNRIIHGQVVTRWSAERPCDGIIAVNDAAAKNPLLKKALKAASEKRVFVWTVEQFLTKMEEAQNSSKNYFVITKEPITMSRLLADEHMQTKEKLLNVGPQCSEEETIVVGINCDVTKEEAKAYEKIHQAGYKIEFQLVPDAAKVTYQEVREKLLDYAGK